MFRCCVDENSSALTCQTRAVFRGRTICYLVALLALGTDIATKSWAVASLSNGQPRPIVGSFLKFQYARNSGAAFSMATGSTWIFTLVAAFVVVGIVVVAGRIRSLAWAVALGLLLGGSLGNLSDRIFRSPGQFRGRVVDWIELPHWPIFNIADSAIVIAASLIALLSIRGIGYRDEVGHRQKSHRASE